MFGGVHNNNFGDTSAFGSQDFGNETLKMVNLNEAHYEPHYEQVNFIGKQTLQSP